MFPSLAFQSLDISVFVFANVCQVIPKSIIIYYRQNMFEEDVFQKVFAIILKTKTLLDVYRPWQDKWQWARLKLR